MVVGGPDSLVETAVDHSRRRVDRCFIGLLSPSVE